MANRPVKFTTFLALLRRYGLLSLPGLLFTGSALFIVLPMTWLLSSGLRKGYEKYDYAAIARDGQATTARITDIAVQYNTSINGEHPRLISYEYEAGGQMRPDKFQTMEADKLAMLHVGDNIQIKELNGQSVIPELKQFSFPFGVFYILPGVFLLLGLPFMLIGLVPALRTYRLYKYGELRQGTIAGSSSNLFMSLLHLQQTTQVAYYYPDRHGARRYGESSTADPVLIYERRPGDAVPLFVSPTDEGRSCLVPRLEALKNNWQL